MNCKICDQETDVRILINSSDEPVCDKCARAIFRHIALAVADNKTVFDIHSRLERKPVEQHPEIAVEVANYLYVTLKKDRKKLFTKETIYDIYVRLISARVNDGATIEELKAVCYFKHKEWKNDPVMRKFLRAKTLFLKSNYENYIADCAHKIPKIKAVSTTRQREIIKELNSYGVKGIANDDTDRLAKELMSTGYENKPFLNMYLKEKI